MKPLPPIGSAAPSFSTQDAGGEALGTDLLGGRKAVLVFLRHLGCSICRMEIAEWKRRTPEFNAAGAEVVLFVDSPDASVGEYVEKEKPPFRLVADPEHKVYSLYAVERGNILHFTAPGAAVKSIKATLKGHMHGRFEGSELQLPGDFVLDENGKILFAHRGTHIGDNTPLDTLLGVVRAGKTDGPASGGGGALSRRTFLVAGAGATATLAAAGGAGYYNHAVDQILSFDPDRVEALYAGRTNLLFEQFPGLRGNLPWLPIGDYPTRVERMELAGVDEMWVKRDDLTSTLYGGNKVRKLEHVLAEAKLAGRRTLMTVGGIGSNQCLAAALHGGKLGFDVDICLFDQPLTPHVVSNLRADLKAGARIVYGGGMAHTVYRAVRRYLGHEKPYYIPIGATTPLGNIGYVTAGFELAEQVRRGEMPEPKHIFVAAGSCGTAAGLIVGCKAAGLKTKVVAVQITEAVVANSFNIVRLARQTSHALHRMDPAFPELSINRSDFLMEGRFYGGGYGKVTPEGVAAVEECKPELHLETTYTGKALAACLHHCRQGSGDGVNLFWDTFSSAPLALADSLEGLPDGLRALVEGA